MAIAIGLVLSQAVFTTREKEPPIIPLRTNRPAPSDKHYRDDHKNTGTNYGNDASRTHAAAWESMKSRSLPKNERVAIQSALLAEWSLVDLKAAVEAALAEADDDLLNACEPGILKDPAMAWELARSGTFGWETAVFREKWISMMSKEDPLRIFEILDEVSLGERVRSVSAVGTTWSEMDAKSPLKGGIWTRLAELGTRTDGGDLRFEVASAIYDRISTEELESLISRNTSHQATQLLAATYALHALYVGEGEFSRVLSKIPAAMRGEFAVTGLRALNLESEHALPMAKIALQEGRLDAFSGSHYHDPTLEDDFALWALGLPDDPGLMCVYQIAVEQSLWTDFGNMVDSVKALPEGRKRDHGAAALVAAMGSGAGDLKNPDIIIGLIKDPVIKASALATWNAREEE